MSKFADLLEQLATNQFKEGAKSFEQNPDYASRCNKRFQILTDVSKLFKGGK